MAGVGFAVATLGVTASEHLTNLCFVGSRQAVALAAEPKARAAMAVRIKHELAGSPQMIGHPRLSGAIHKTTTAAA